MFRAPSARCQNGRRNAATTLDSAVVTELYFKSQKSGGGSPGVIHYDVSAVTQSSTGAGGSSTISTFGCSLCRPFAPLTWFAPWTMEGRPDGT